MGRKETLIQRYGEEEATRMMKEWSSRGGKSGGNGLKGLTPEQRSELGKQNYKKMRAKFTDEEWKLKQKKASNKRWVDSLSTPKKGKV